MKNKMKDDIKTNDSTDLMLDQKRNADTELPGVGRREFINKSIGTAVLGAAVIGGVGSAFAADTVVPTVDLKTLKPGDRANDLYAPQEGFNDTDATWWPGRGFSGVTIGILQFQANLPMIPGNMGNATTFDFPITYRLMDAENVYDAGVAHDAQARAQFDRRSRPGQRGVPGLAAPRRWHEPSGARKNQIG